MSESIATNWTPSINILEVTESMLIFLQRNKMINEISTNSPTVGDIIIETNGNTTECLQGKKICKTKKSNRKLRS